MSGRVALELLLEKMNCKEKSLKLTKRLGIKDIGREIQR